MPHKSKESVTSGDEGRKKPGQNLSKTDYAVIAVLNDMQAKYAMERDASSKRKDQFAGAAEELQNYIQTTLKSLLKTSIGGIQVEEQAPMRMNPALMAQISSGKKLNRIQRKSSESSLSSASSADSTSASDSDNEQEQTQNIRERLQANMAKNLAAQPLKSKARKTAEQIKQEKIQEINKLLTEIDFLAGTAPREVAALVSQLQDIKAEVSRYKEQIDAKQTQLGELNRLAQAAKSTSLSAEEKIVAANFDQAISATEKAGLSDEKRQEIIRKVAKRIKVMGQKENVDLIKHLIKADVVNEVKTAPVTFEKGVAKQKSQAQAQSKEAKLVQEMAEKLFTRSLLSSYKNDREFYARVAEYLAPLRTRDKEPIPVTFEYAFADPEMHAQIVTIYNARLDELARADEAEIAERLKLEAERAAALARQTEAEARSLLESEGITFATGSAAIFNTNLQARLAQAISLAKRDLMQIPAIIKDLDRAIVQAEAAIPKLHRALSEDVRKGSLVMSNDAAVAGGNTAQGTRLSEEQKRILELDAKIIASYNSLLPVLLEYIENINEINSNVRSKNSKPNAAALKELIKELKAQQAISSKSVNKKQIETLITVTINTVEIANKIGMTPKQASIFTRALNKILDAVVGVVHNAQFLFGLRKQKPLSIAKLKELENTKQRVLNIIQNLRPTQEL